MLGRLFKFFVLCAVAVFLARWLLGYRQRQSLHEFFRVLAFALLASAVLLSGIFLLTGNRL